MSTVTLGFEEDTFLSKQEIARIQLVEAIVQFLAGKYVCAITLAGAAEAVLAGLLTQRGRATVVEDSVATMRSIMEVAGLVMFNGKKDNETFNEWNAVRNKLKHHGKSEDELVGLNLFDEAYWMIKRGMVNAEKLSIGIANQDAFENWITQNINM